MSRYRRDAIHALIGLAILGAEALILGTLVPAAGSGSRGAPGPILFLGVIHGLIDSLTAVGIVLVYRSVRVINFAQAAIGAAGFVLVYNLVVLTPVPFPIALVLGLAVAAAVGLLFELILVRRFFHAPRLVLTVFTIVAASFVAGSARNAIDSLPIFPEKAARSVAQINATVDLPKMLPFSGFTFRLPGSPIEFGFVHIFAIALVGVTLAAVTYFLRSTRLGVAVRALAENSERAALLGISVGMVSAVIWALSGLLSGVSATLNGLLGSTSSSFGFSTDLLLPALAAAVLARMDRIWVAVAASVGIELLRSSVGFLQPSYASLVTAVLFGVVVVGLLTQRVRAGRSEQGGTGSWHATDEVRATPIELARLAPVRAAKWTLAAIGIVGIGIFPFVSSKGQVYLASVVAIHAMLGVSLVVLTGWAGQVSLGQFGLAAVGAAVAGALASPLPFFLAIPIAAIITAGIAVAVGIPALRLPGLFLAVATFAFAAAVHAVLFNEQLFGWLLPDRGVDRPKLFVIDFEDERSMFFFVLVMLAATLIAVRNIRRSRYGRILIGLRDNEPNAESAGVPPLRMKLVAFGVAGAIAGMAGALLAYQQRAVTAPTYTAEASVDLFVMAVMGGVGNIAGPLLGAGVLNALRTSLAGFPELAASVTPMVAIVLLYLAPGGLISVAAKMRDAVLRIVAQRNNILVPSLFADVDPESLHLRLVPIASPIETMGLARVQDRYDVPSVHADMRAANGHSDEGAALAAAARAVTQETES